ncbi:MAG TPA: HEPN domain-containing protein [Acidobacteriota bacterium]|jgi:HEPN domain-containing protein|nr:HEPN domain-containing protein [Acidobacteriota bacterium]
MKNGPKEAQRWLAQAENDLEFAQLALREKFYAQACFISQQIGEKALKAVAYFHGERFVLGHSILELVNRLKVKDTSIAELSELAGVLDQYYIPTRYPNGLPDGVPFQFFNQRQAQEAVEGARRLVDTARRLISAAL